MRFPASELIQQTLEILPLFQWAALIARALAQLLKDLLRAAIDILPLQQIAIRADRGAAPDLTAQRIGLAAAAIRALSLVFRSGLTRLAIVLRHRPIHMAQTFAQRIHRLRLIIERARHIIVAQGLFRLVHRLARAAKHIMRRPAIGRARDRQIPMPLLIQMLTQGALPLGEILTIQPLPRVLTRAGART